MSSPNNAFQPDKVIRAKKGESTWTVAANERTRIMVPHFIDRVAWRGIGWPRVVAPGAEVTLEVDCVWFGQGSGVDITVSDSQGTVEETVHRTVYGDRVKHTFRVPNEARGLLLVKVAIPTSDRPDWDAGLEEGDLERMAPAVKIVPSLLQQAKFDAEEVMEGDDVSLTVQTSRDKQRYRGQFEVGRLETYGGKEIFIRQAGPFYAYPEKAGGYEVQWNVTTPMIDRSEILAQWQIDAAKQDAEAKGATYSGPDAYRGIELIARAKHLGLQTDSTEASRTGPDWTGTLMVLDNLRLQLVDGRTGVPYADQDVTLTLADGTKETVTTDADGIAERERIPPGPVRIHGKGIDPLPAPYRAEAETDQSRANVPEDCILLHMDASVPMTTVSTGSTQTVAVVWPTVDLQFENGLFGTPASDIDYMLDITTSDDASTQRVGTLSENGRLTEIVPPNVTDLALTLTLDDRTLTLPLTIEATSAEWAGGTSQDDTVRTKIAARRLQNLGLLDRANQDTAAAPDALRHAVRVFQERTGLPETGKLTDMTLQMLDRLHLRSK